MKIIREYFELSGSAFLLFVVVVLVGMYVLTLFEAPRPSDEFIAQQTAEMCHGKPVTKQITNTFIDGVNITTWCENGDVVLRQFDK